MEDSEEEDPIEELCEYLDDKVGHYCEVGNINATETAIFYKIYYEYKKRLRNGDIHPPNRPQFAFRKQFDSHRVTQKLLHEDLNSWKHADSEWTAHAKESQMKHPNLLDKYEPPHQTTTEGMKEWIVELKLQSTIPTSGQELWKKY